MSRYADDTTNFGTFINAADQKAKLRVVTTTLRGTGDQPVAATCDIKAMLSHLAFDDNIRPMMLQALLDYERWLARQEKQIKIRVL
jgi:hypothetical protein